MLNSKIHECSVMHSREHQAQHAFHYKVLYHQFDLDELEQLNRSIWGFALNKASLTSFDEQDYLMPNQRGSLKSRVLQFVQAQGVTTVQHIKLITTVKLLGYTFNPVCFFLCFDSQHQFIASVVEVRNTFGEKHLYFLKDFNLKQGVYHAKHQKLFHVSPFFDLKGDYEFRFKDLDGDFQIDIDLIKNKKLALKTYLKSTQSQSLTTSTHWKFFSKYPFTLFLTVPRILFEAGVLYYKKKVSFYKKPIPQTDLTFTLKRMTVVQKIFFKIFSLYFKKLQKGQLILSMPDNKKVVFGDLDCKKPALLTVKTNSFFKFVVLNGSVGFGEAYMQGMIQTPNLDHVLHTLSVNQELLKQNFNWVSSLSRFWNRLQHKLRQNSLFQTKKNISEHYDLSNDLYKTFLDQSMTYSAGLFPTPNTSLVQSQILKRDRIIEMMDLKPEHRVLEIGSGWGSLAIEMAKQKSVHVDSATLSVEQKEFADDWIQNEDLKDKVSIHLKDYRLLSGAYDRIVSIEMLEAVGHEYFADFFKTLDRLLKPGGKAVLQVITIPHKRYHTYKNSCDFIQKHIFPGGFLPSVEALKECMAEHSDFVMTRMDSIGMHYAETIKHWKKSFLESTHKIKSLGFDDSFIRKFHYYFSYCEVGFRNHLIDTVQIVLERKSEVRV